jgi:hypothetical protein
MSYGQAQTVCTQTRRVRKNPRKLWGLFLMGCVTPLLSFLSGCAGYTGKASQTSSAAAFQLSPSSLSFGQIVVGKQANQVVSVSNTGNVAINLTQLSLSNPHFSLTGVKTPMALAVGQTGTFGVAVNPTVTGALTGTLTAQADHGTSPAVVNLSATVVSPQSQIAVSPTSINFGTVSTGLKTSSNLLITNSGGSDLTISMLNLAGAEFSLNGVTTPKTIAAGQSAQVVMTFSPTTAGTATGSLSITSNDVTNPTITIPMNGTATTAATGQLSANPNSISFGTVATGSSAAKHVVLTNTGNVAVKISSLSSQGLGLTTSGMTAPVTLNPSESLTVTAAFAPTAAGSSNGSIIIVSDAANSSLTIPSTGTGAQGDLVISPSSYNFGSVVDGQTKSQTIALTNTGTAALTITQFTASGSAYSVSGLATPVTVPPGGSKTFNVLFAPTTAGSLAGSVGITTNASDSPSVLTLTGTGSAASVTLASNPGSVTFSGVGSGSSNSKTVTLSNAGTASLTISQITVNAKDFSISGMVTPLTLAAGQNATISVTFKPTASENITGNITVASAQGANTVISVAGSAVQPALAVTPSSASFGNVTEGTPATQTIQLSNSGTGTLLVTQLSVAGSGFSTGTLALPVTLISGQSTTFNVEFAPTSAGSTSGSVTVVSNAPNSPALISLTGTGIAATQSLSFSASNLAFGSVNAGSSSTQNVTVTNAGNSSVTISQIAESGAGFALSGASAPVSLNAGQSMIFGVIFSPNAAGNDTGTVVVTSTAAGSPKSIALSGTGVQTASHSVALAWTPSTSAVVGYNVYRSTANGSGYGKINSGLVAAAAFDDSNVQNGSTYYYVVTAVDASGNESTNSNQATAVIP